MRISPQELARVRAERIDAYGPSRARWALVRAQARADYRAREAEIRRHALRGY